MPALNIEIGYFGNKKTVRLVARLGPGSELLPIKLWDFVGRYHPESGALVDYTVPEIEAIIGWKGDHGKALEALVAVGFLDAKLQPISESNPQSQTTVYVCHDWQEHEGHLVAFNIRAKKGTKLGGEGTLGRRQKMLQASNKLA